MDWKSTMTCNNRSRKALPKAAVREWSFTRAKTFDFPYDSPRMQHRRQIANDGAVRTYVHVIP
jgi:hypothetical protein